MIKKIIPWLIILLLIADQTYSFLQQEATITDGDVANIAAPAPHYTDVLQDPLGLKALLKHEEYAAPNRSFAHWTVYAYFNHVPLWFHAVADPVESFYLSCATAKTAMKILLIFTLACYICIDRLSFRNILVAALLITPLFQTYGYNHSMGVIDTAISYAFFYALPMGLLLVFFFPFYKGLYRNEAITLSWWSIILMSGLMVFLSLNGPLTPAVVVLVCPLVLLNAWYKAFRVQPVAGFFKRSIHAVENISRPLLIFCVCFFLLSLYSIYIGQYNGENHPGVNLAERYKRLPVGLYEIITEDIGLPLLLLFVLGNALLIYFQREVYREKVLTVLKWIGIFSVLYIALLPLGGYRPYRPNIIRYDTVIPVTLCLIYFFGLSTFYLLSDIKALYKKVYALLVAVTLLWFLKVEENWYFRNDCEKAQFYTYYHSNDKVVTLSPDCNLLCWGVIENHEHSDVIAAFMMKLGVTKEMKYYVQKKQ